MCLLEGSAMSGHRSWGLTAAHLAGGRADAWQGGIRPLICPSARFPITPPPSSLLRRRYSAHYAIVAMPPHLSGRILYRPQLPRMRNQLVDRTPMGTTVKVRYHAYQGAWQPHSARGLLLPWRFSNIQARYSLALLLHSL